MIDVTGQISAVRRQIGSKVLEVGEARVMTVAQTYDSPVEDVWDACTNPERIPRWFMPVSGDLQVGGRYQLEGNAGGVIERCDPPTSFAATWEFGGEVSWIEVRLTSVPEGTRFELEHVAHVKDELWAQFGPGAVGIGWDGAFLGLALHLAGDTSVTPETAMAWQLSEEGLRFSTLSGQAWCEASVEWGTDRAEAEAAAERVNAFYTTPPEEPEGA